MHWNRPGLGPHPFALQGPPPGCCVSHEKPQPLALAWPQDRRCPAPGTPLIPVSPKQQKATCLLPHSPPRVTTSLPTKVPRTRLLRGSGKSLDACFPPGEADSRDGAMQKLTASGRKLPGHSHLGKGHATLLTSRQAGHWTHGQLPRDTIAPQLMPVLLLRLPCRSMSQHSYGTPSVTQGPRCPELAGCHGRAACARPAWRGRNSAATSRQFPPKQGLCGENLTDTIRTGAAGLVTDSK